MCVENVETLGRYSPSLKQAPAFQFGVWDMLLLMSLACVFFAISRGLGLYWASLLAGCGFIALVVLRMQFQSMLAGAGCGMLTAVLIVLGLWLLGGQQVSPLGIAFSLLFYPLVGYMLGLVCTADRVIRAGS